MANYDYIDIIVATITAALFFVFIYYTRKKNTFENYSVADRSVGMLLLFASSSANYIGPGFTIGLVGKGFSTGYLFFFIMLVYGMSKIIEGLFIAPNIRNKFKTSYTIGGIIGGKDSHNNKIVQFVAGVISFLLMIGFCGIMTMAGGSIINSFLGVDKLWGIIIITSISISIAVFGGLQSSMISDLLQFFLFIVLLPLLGIIAIYKSNLSLDSFIMTAKQLTTIGYNDMSIIAIVGLLVTWFFGEMLVPPTISCILSSKDSKTAKKALSYSGIFMIIWLFIMLSIGIISKVSGIDDLSPDSVLFKLGSLYLPVGLLGFFSIALLGVIVSTQDSLINSASVIFSVDIINVIKPGSAKRNLLVSRIAGIFVGIIAIVFALKTPSILEGLANIYSVWAPTILIALLTSIFLKKVYWQSVLLSMIFGGASSLLVKYSSITIPSIIMGIIISLVVYFSMHFYMKANAQS